MCCNKSVTVPIPVDLLSLILKYLTAGEMRDSEQVCKKWKSVLEGSQYYKTVRNLNGVLAIGGYDGITELESAELYTPNSNKWAPFKKMRHRRSHVGCSVIDRRIYVVGGRDGDQRLKVCEVYDPFEGKWLSMPSMNRRRSSLSLRSVGNCLYAFGGYDGSQENGAAEVYNVETQQWSDIATDRPRSQMASAVLGSYVYLLGGCRNSGRDILREACRYNVLSNTFESLPDMTEKRLSSAATVLNDLVYVLGGSNDSYVHQSVECFDPRCNTWSRAADLSKKRVNLGSVTFENTILVIGGFHSQLNQLSVVERFFPRDHPQYTEVVKETATNICCNNVGVPTEGCPGAWKTCRYVLVVIKKIFVFSSK